MKLPKHTNTRIYIVSLLIPVVLTVILILMSFILPIFLVSIGAGREVILMSNLMTFLIIPLFFVLILIPLFTYMVLYLIQIYRMWDVINDGHSRATPGEALGYLFVPFYNLYWIFDIWGGFPTDYNAFVERHSVTDKVPLLKPTIYQLFPVLILLSVLVITTPVLLVYFAFLLNSSNKAIDSLKTAVAESRQQFAQQQPANMALQPQLNY